MLSLVCIHRVGSLVYHNAERMYHRVKGPASKRCVALMTNFDYIAKRCDAFFLRIAKSFAIQHNVRMLDILNQRLVS